MCFNYFVQYAAGKIISAVKAVFICRLIEKLQRDNAINCDTLTTEHREATENKHYALQSFWTVLQTLLLLLLLLLLTNNMFKVTLRQQAVAKALYKN